MTDLEFDAKDVEIKSNNIDGLIISTTCTSDWQILNAYSPQVLIKNYYCLEELYLLLKKRYEDEY